MMRTVVVRDYDNFIHWAWNGLYEFLEKLADSLLIRAASHCGHPVYLFVSAADSAYDCGVSPAFRLIRQMNGVVCPCLSLHWRPQ